MTNETERDPVGALVDRFIARAQRELAHRWNTWALDLSRNEVHEVVGALMARQVTLACQLASSPLIWNGHTAPIILRAMADVYITLAWVLRDPVERSRKFIHFGLGQLKLSIEHRRAEFEKRAVLEGEREQVEAQEVWLNSQRASFLTDVNLGSWSGASTREMAVEAGCLDFYNYVYVPFSGCAHSMWQHVGAYNLKRCTNPLHRMHSVPDASEPPISADYLYLAGKYLQKTMRAVDDTVGTSFPEKSAFEMLCEDLDAEEDSGVSGGQTSPEKVGDPQ